ncbi:MAG: hypothetical protein WCC66_06675 [Rhizobiaceae bacterium]
MDRLMPNLLFMAFPAKARDERAVSLKGKTNACFHGAGPGKSLWHKVFPGKRRKLAMSHNGLDVVLSLPSIFAKRK